MILSEVDALMSLGIPPGATLIPSDFPEDIFASRNYFGIPSRKKNAISHGVLSEISPEVPSGFAPFFWD